MLLVERRLLEAIVGVHGRQRGRPRAHELRVDHGAQRLGHGRDGRGGGLDRQRLKVGAREKLQLDLAHAKLFVDRLPCAVLGCAFVQREVVIKVAACSGRSLAAEDTGRTGISAPAERDVERKERLLEGIDRSRLIDIRFAMLKILLFHNTLFSFSKIRVTFFFTDREKKTHRCACYE